MPRHSSTMMMWTCDCTVTTDRIAEMLALSTALCCSSVLPLSVHTYNNDDISMWQLLMCVLQNAPAATCSLCKYDVLYVYCTCTSVYSSGKQHVFVVNFGGRWHAHLLPEQLQTALERRPMCLFLVANV